ncbi:MAG TPA: sulfite exporter TauE/SafE family protein [Gaiellaceae bacterium]|nr:sulfite exporter TauE/SafE family protein [Gaiellaceae bacterium]
MPFSAETAVLLGLLGIGVGAFGTLVGAGGGFILTPVLVLLYPHDSPQTLTAISLAVVFFNAASGSLAYARQGRIDYHSGLVFGAATIPGAIGGALAVGVTPRRVFDLVMAIVLVTLACWLVLGKVGENGRNGRTGQARALTDRSGRHYVYRVPLRLGGLYSLAVGFFSSFLGIGGGVIHVPVLVRALGFPTHIATATSHFVLAQMAGAGTLTHVVAGSFSHGHGLRRTAALSVGVVLGAQAGALTSLRLNAAVIEWLLALALAGLSARCSRSSREQRLLHQNVATCRPTRLTRSRRERGRHRRGLEHGPAPDRSRQRPPVARARGADGVDPARF